MREVESIEARACERFELRKLKGAGWFHGGSQMG